ncbi:MAG: NBR1-Ig-like domain-containing protein [Anaerolineae bacterium]
MLFRKSSWLGIAFVLALTLTACNIGATPQPTVDVGAIYTVAAQTALADLSQQLTATALAASPTPQPTATLPPPTATNTLAPNTTPFATFPVGNVTPGGIFTPIASVAPPAGTATGSLCDNSAFVADITVPDGTVMKPGEDFYKIWRLKNTGICTWDEGYQLAFAWGDPLDGVPFNIKQKDDFVLPGATTDIGINMTAHLAPGEYSGCWRMKNDHGVFFGAVVCVNIKVVKK